MEILEKHIAPGPRPVCSVRPAAPVPWRMVYVSAAAVSVLLLVKVTKIHRSGDPVSLAVITCMAEEEEREQGTPEPGRPLSAQPLLISNGAGPASCLPREVGNTSGARTVPISGSGS